MTERPVEQKEDPKLAERQPWTPKGIWGHKDPAEMSLAEKEAMLEKAKYSGPLATAYWENEIAREQEQPEREESGAKKKRVEELEEEVRQLNEKIVRTKKGKEQELEEEEELGSEPEEEEIEMNRELAKSAKEELVEKKKGVGEKFKDGVKGVYDFFKKKLTKEEEERPSEERGSGEPSRANPEKKPEKQEMSQEEREKEIEVLKEQIRALREERYRRSREMGVIEQTKIEEEYAPRIKELEAKILELEKGGRKRITGREVVGFLWERTKGMIGFGWWEAHQAEKFRLGTKETGQDLKVQSELLEQEEGLMLNPDEAWEEAQEIEGKREKEEKDWTENQGAEPKDARRLAVEFISAQISSRKREYNKKIEDKMVAGALLKLEDKLKSKSWIQEYMAANGGKVVTPEKMQEVEKRIREEIGKLRKGQLRKDFIDFVKLSRNSLDKRWWSRYIYAGLDAVLAGLFFKWLVSRGVEKAVVGKTAGGTGGKAAGAKGVELATETGLKDTIWAESKRMLLEQGVGNPTNVQIQNVATQIAHDSGVKVISKATGEVIWQQTVGGVAKDIALQKGFLLKLGGASKTIAAIKAGIGLI